MLCKRTCVQELLADLDPEDQKQLQVLPSAGCLPCVSPRAADVRIGSDSAVSALGLEPPRLPCMPHVAGTRLSRTLHAGRARCTQAVTKACRRAARLDQRFAVCAQGSEPDLEEVLRLMHKQRERE